MRVDYHEYINSPEWRKRADAAKHRAGYRCQVCNRSSRDVILDAHHRTYEKLGNEAPEDITVLCRDCHELYELHGGQRKPTATLSSSLVRTFLVAWKWLVLIIITIPVIVAIPVFFFTPSYVYESSTSTPTQQPTYTKDVIARSKHQVIPSLEATLTSFASAKSPEPPLRSAIPLAAQDARSCSGGCTSYPAWCDPAVKGNISYNTGEKIYHVFGQNYYSETVINPRYGERWFCTEQEARAAGWRKSRQ